MEIKTIDINIPDYLTVEQYTKILKIPETLTKLQHNLELISIVTGIPTNELEYWDLESVKKVSNLIVELMDPQTEFHSVLEWNGKLYGYSNIKQQSIGEYIDLENYSKDIVNNLPKICSILYRPITSHRFDSIEFIVKNTYKVLKHKEVENVFDYYDIRKYTSEYRREVENTFRHFPVHVLLGALGFFLLTGALYLNSTVYSQEGNQKILKKMNQDLLESLLQNIGDGGGLYTNSVKPISYQFQERRELQT